MRSYAFVFPVALALLILPSAGDAAPSRPRIAQPRTSVASYQRGIEAELAASRGRIERTILRHRLGGPRLQHLRHDVMRGESVLRQTVANVTRDGALTQADVRYVHAVAEAVRNGLARSHGPLDSWKLIAF